jgi:riboflavin kinase / FMN adenylyltransferase
MAVATMGYRDSPPSSFRGGVLAIGNFDGVHLGHAALMREAAKIGRPVIAVTFDPHPMQILTPDKYRPPLTTVEYRAELLQKIGADHVTILETDAALLALSPEYFFETIVAGVHAARGIVEGFNFRFGKDRAGTNDLLRQLSEARGIAFREVPAHEIAGQPVSSSRVRNAIEVGRISEATSLLGHPYTLIGQVVAGAKRGHTIGFPTANLDNIATLIPGDGVYAVRVTVGNRTYSGAANIGPNPTFNDGQRKVEVHLLDFNDNIYFETISVDFISRLRETIKFPNVDALTAQLKLDLLAVRELFRPQQSRFEVPK